MAVTVETQDCTSMGDSDVAEMLKLLSLSTNAFDAELLQGQLESWVLLTRARDNGRLRGFSFFTLERIGGTPCILIGAGHTCRTTRRNTVLNAINRNQKRRAALSFPDEDVLIGMRIVDPGAFEVSRLLHDVVPRPGHKATGEERAWGRRLAKRFGIGTFSYQDRIFTTRGKGAPAVMYDHASLNPNKIPPEHLDFVSHINEDDGDTVIVHGWVRSEELEKLL